MNEVLLTEPFGTQNQSKNVCEHMFCGAWQVCEHMCCGQRQVCEHMCCGQRQVCEHMCCGPGQVCEHMCCGPGQVCEHMFCGPKQVILRSQPGRAPKNKCSCSSWHAVATGVRAKARVFMFLLGCGRNQSARQNTCVHVPLDICSKKANKQPLALPRDLCDIILNLSGRAMECERVGAARSGGGSDGSAHGPNMSG